MLRKQKIFFLSLFLILLVFPVCFHSKEKISLRENRTLARFPSLTAENGLNFKFGKEFEEWFDDHFFKREQIIDLRFLIRHKINGIVENDQAFIGDNGWIFEKEGTVNTQSLEYQRKNIENDADILKRFDDKFKDKVIPVYLVLVPDRLRIYQKYWENHYTPKPALNYENEITKALADHGNIKIITFFDEFMHSPEKDSLYYKDDFHLTYKARHRIQRELYDHFLKTELKDLTVSPVKHELKSRIRRNTFFSSLFGEKGYQDEEALLIDYQFPIYDQYEEVDFKSFRLDDEWGNIEGVVYRKGRSRFPGSVNKSFFSLGPCYAEDAFILFRNVFKESVYIRTNLGDQYGSEAKKRQINEIRKLFTLEKDSAVIVLIINTHYREEDDIEYIKLALEE